MVVVVLRREGNKNGFMFRVNASAGKGSNFGFYLAASYLSFYLNRSPTHRPLHTPSLPSSLPHTPSHTQGGSVVVVVAASFLFVVVFQSNEKTKQDRMIIRENLYIYIKTRKKRRETKGRRPMLPHPLSFSPSMYTRNNIITQGGKNW